MAELQGAPHECAGLCWLSGPLSMVCVALFFQVDKTLVVGEGTAGGRRLIVLEPDKLTTMETII